MHTTVVTFCDVCLENVDALIADCDSCFEKQLTCEHLICTECSVDL